MTINILSTEGYNGHKTENVTFVDNTTYDYYVDYKHIQLQ